MSSGPVTPQNPLTSRIHDKIQNMSQTTDFEIGALFTIINSPVNIFLNLEMYLTGD